MNKVRGKMHPTLIAISRAISHWKPPSKAWTLEFEFVPCKAENPGETDSIEIYKHYRVAAEPGLSVVEFAFASDDFIPLPKLPSEVFDRYLKIENTLCVENGLWHLLTACPEICKHEGYMGHVDYLFGTGASTFSDAVEVFQEEGRLPWGDIFNVGNTSVTEFWDLFFVTNRTFRKVICDYFITLYQSIFPLHQHRFSQSPIKAFFIHYRRARFFTDKVLFPTDEDLLEYMKCVRGEDTERHVIEHLLSSLHSLPAELLEEKFSDLTHRLSLAFSILRRPKKQIEPVLLAMKEYGSTEFSSSPLIKYQLARIILSHLNNPQVYEMFLRHSGCIPSVLTSFMLRFLKTGKEDEKTFIIKRFKQYQETKLQRLKDKHPLCFWLRLL